MALLKANIPNQVSVIAGKFKMSTGFTDVIGGTMTAGSADAAGSALITWAPAMISAPTILVSLDGFGANTSNIAVAQLTGVTVSNAYIAIGTTPASGATVSVMVVGQARL